MTHHQPMRRANADTSGSKSKVILPAKPNPDHDNLFRITSLAQRDKRCVIDLSQPTSLAKASVKKQFARGSNKGEAGRSGGLFDVSWRSGAKLNIHS